MDQPLDRTTLNGWIQTYINKTEQAIQGTPPPFRDIINHITKSYMCKCKHGTQTDRYTNNGCTCANQVIPSTKIMNIICMELHIRAAAYSNPYLDNSHFSLWASTYPDDSWLGATHTIDELNWTDRYTFVNPPAEYWERTINRIIEHLKKNDKPKRMVLTMRATSDEEREGVISRLRDNTCDDVEIETLATITGKSGALRPSVPWASTRTLTLDEDVHLILIQNILAQRMDAVNIRNLIQKINNANSKDEENVEDEIYELDNENMQKVSPPVTLKSIIANRKRKITQRPHEIIRVPTVTQDDVKQDQWMEWTQPWKKRKSKELQTKWTTAADSIAHHPRMAGIAGILPPKIRSKQSKAGDPIKRKSYCITEVTAEARNKIRKISTKTLQAILEIRKQHRKQKWPPDKPIG
jgi:hypothetical protein